MSDSNQDTDGSPGRPSKVPRVIETYDLEGLGDELETAWTAPESDRQSLRDLADLVNRRIVESVLEQRGNRPLAGEIETVYAGLQEEADSATIRDVTTRLENLGVSTTDLESDLVSYQAVRTYLQSVRGAEYERKESDPIGATRDRIQSLQGRLQVVAEGQIEELAARDAITLGDSRVLVGVQVYCEDCGRQFDVEELLERGGCDCE
jgi:hypothetical protein